MGRIAEETIQQIRDRVDIVDLVGGRHSNISQQLKMLTLAGYLTKERKERLIIYHLHDEKIKTTVKFLCEHFKEKN